MSVTQLRVGQKQMVIGMPNLQIYPRGGAAAAIPWWLSGGIRAANCIAAYDAKNAISQAASYVNLANPGTYDATLGVAPTWANGTGWTFNGSTNYLKTSIVMPSGGSVIIRFTGATQVSDQHLFGAYTDINRYFAICANSNGRAGILYSNFAVLIVAPKVTSGVLAMSAQTAYRDGVSDGTIPAGADATIYQVYLGCLNAAGGAYGFTNATFVAISFYDIAIDSYIGDLTTAINAL